LHASASPSSLRPRSKPKLGLRAWMSRVLEECDRASVAFAADPVHDLRVAIRRCRSLADGIIPIDPDRRWKELKKDAKKLFSALGDVRDMHVMLEWVEKLFPADDAVAQALVAFTQAEEQRLKQTAREELDSFDRKAWSQLERTLPGRLSALRPGHIVFKHLALERWTEAYALHQRAMRNRSVAALHQARIGIKRLRYTVENFLPRQHAEWGRDLKEIQDLLGEIHDLDVLWRAALQIHAFPDADTRSRWHKTILEARDQRLARYRDVMTGKQSLWLQWRLQLPPAEQVSSAALSRLKVWASFLDPDFQKSRHAANLSLQLFHGLAAHALVPAGHERNLELILEIAALARNVGRARGQRVRPKASARRLGKMQTPLGWCDHDLKLAAAVVRYHHRRLPAARHSTMRTLELPDRRAVILLAGILRIASALDSDHSGRVTQIVVEQRKSQLYVYARGFSASSALAQEIAAARYLLESALRRPILVRPLRSSPAKKTKQRHPQPLASPQLKLIA
jgi:CHAD domain-containing protein